MPRLAPFALLLFAAPAPAADVATLPAALAAVEGALARNERLTADEAKQAETLLLQALRDPASKEAKTVADKLAPLLAKSDAAPTPAKPVAASDSTARLAVGLRAKIGLSLPADKVRPDPAAAAFPGPVPASAKRGTKSVEIASTKGFICNGVGVSEKADVWHSTGLYAAPGEVVRVTLPPALAGRGLGVRVGGHTDRLWKLDSWKRAPEVSRWEPLLTATTAVANPFGGLVYVTVPAGVDLKGKVSVAGAVEAPLYVRGQTTPEQWKAARAAGAPWGEFVGKNVVLTVPADAARLVADPAELVAFWDDVLDACADLTAVPRQRGRAERLMHDVQISAGYMHSGYPIMGPLGELKTLLDTAKVRREGAWGYFHELGHNHQQRDWTFDGTTEVTCNLYSLYLQEKFSPKAAMRGEMTPAGIAKNTAKHKAGGSSFDDWKKEPFTALILYKQLKDEFGWPAYLKVFAEYQALPAAERPKGDAAERDQFCVRMSKAVGRNLGPLFASWGVPVSADARAETKGLPAWLPGE